MGPVSPPPAPDDPAVPSPIDPISRRTKSSGPQQASRPAQSPGPVDERDPTRSRQSSEAVPLRRVDTSTSNKLTKDKNKGVSFLSRIMGGKKRDETDHVDTAVPETSENRSTGNEAEVFSGPMGFIPRFPSPPRYIKVKAQNRRRRDFDRLFLSQVLLDSSPRSNSRKVSIDSKIHSIDDAPAAQVPATPRTGNVAIWAMEFSKDGKYLAAAGQDKKLRVWEVIQAPEDRHGEGQADEGDEAKLHAPVFKRKLLREYDGHTASVLDLSWSKNNFLLSSSMDKTVRLYHISREECLCAFKHNDFVTSIQFHPRDDRFFLAGSLDNKIRLWSIPDKNVAFVQQVPDMVTAVAFTPDGKTAIAGTLNGLCILYDTEGLKAHSQIHVKSARGKNSKGSKVTGIDTIAIPRENGQADVKILITSNDSRIRMYNLKDRTLEIKFRGNENSCSQIHASFSDDGRFVICGSEDRKVYIWPTGPHEGTEGDKRPFEVFEAHSAIVTTAILVPTATRRHLAQSGDPIFDLCNPPPVTLLSRADSALSSGTPTHRSSNSADNNDRHASILDSRIPESPKRAPEPPGYLNRHSHHDGYIIVTADYTGQIKVFRQDCAYQKRRQESWDDSSTFSKKMLGRSGSVMTRNSVASSIQRQSMSQLALGSVGTGGGQNSPAVSVAEGNGGKNGSSERILNWRNSIHWDGPGNNSATVSEINLKQSLGGDAERARSVSPGTNGSKSNWKKRLSLKREPTPLKESNNNNNKNRASVSVDTKGSALPSIEVTRDTPVVDGSESFTNGKATTQNSNGLHPDPATGKLNKVLVPDRDDPLLLVEGQSMMAWDVNRTFVPMAQRSARTPGLVGPDGNPLSRANSFVSELSSEVLSSDGGGGAGSWTGQKRDSFISDGDGVGAEAGNKLGIPGSQDEEDLKCKNCGSGSFRALVTEAKQVLRCKRCGTVV